MNLTRLVLGLAMMLGCWAAAAQETAHYPVTPMKNQDGWLVWQPGVAVAEMPIVVDQDGLVNPDDLAAFIARFFGGEC